MVRLGEVLPLSSGVGGRRTGGAASGAAGARPRVHEEGRFPHAAPQELDFEGAPGMSRVGSEPAPWYI